MNFSNQLIDRFGRTHTSLRISVTDRCNIRCFYCMPSELVQFKPREELLSFEEIERFARVMTTLGVRKFRLTGGEPLVRSDLSDLVQRIARIPGVEDLALTTNGILLADQAADLKAAGLDRLNISLDALSPEVFEQIARRPGVERVLAGIKAAIDVGFKNIRLNAVSIRGLTEDEVVPLALFARQNKLELRFIEYMPLNAEGDWNRDQVLSGVEVRRMIDRHVGNLVAARRDDMSQPAVDFDYLDGSGRVGFINPVTNAFCGDCNRLRLTAEGQVRNCLFSIEEWDARQVMRSGGTDQEIAALVQDCVQHKKAGHGIDSDDFVKPARAMYQIGG